MSIIKYVKNIGTYFGASLIPMVLGLVTNPLLASNLSPEDYAITGYFTSFNTLIQPLIVFYMIHFFIKEYFRRDEEQRRILFAVIAKMLIWFSAIVSVVCFFGILIYIKFISTDFSLPISPYLAMSVFCLPITGLFSLMQARHRMKRESQAFFRLTLTNGILNIALTLLFVVIIKWGAFGKLLGPLVANIGIFCFLTIRLKNQIFISTPTKEYLDILKFCWPLAISAMLGYFTNGFDRTYLESIGDVSTYGLYIVGTSIAAYLNTFSGAVYNTFQPDLYETIIKRNYRKYFKYVGLQVGIVAASIIVFILVAPYLIAVLTAFRYMDSTPFAQIISVSTIASSLYFILNDYTITVNKPKIYLYTSIIGSIAIVALMPLMVDAWGFYGGAWMKSLSFMGMALINLILLAISFLYNRHQTIPAQHRT